MRNDHQVTNLMVNKQITGASDARLELIAQILENQIAAGSFASDRATENQAKASLARIRAEIQARVEVRDLRA